MLLDLQDPMIQIIFYDADDLYDLYELMMLTILWFWTMRNLLSLWCWWSHDTRSSTTYDFYDTNEQLWEPMIFFDANANIVFHMTLDPQELMILWYSIFNILWFLPMIPWYLRFKSLWFMIPDFKESSFQEPMISWYTTFNDPRLYDSWHSKKIFFRMILLSWLVKIESNDFWFSSKSDSEFQNPPTHIFYVSFFLFS